MEITTKGFEELVKELQLLPVEISRVARNSVNTAATDIRKFSIEEAFNVYHIKNKTRLNKDSKGRNVSSVIRARLGEASATIRYIGGAGKRDSDRLGLHHFKTDKQERNTKRKGWQPSFKVRRGSSVMKLERGFYGVGKLKGQGLFQRNIKGRKIVRRTGPGLKLMIESKHVYPAVEAYGLAAIDRHVIDAISKQLTKRRL